VTETVLVSWTQWEQQDMFPLYVNEEFVHKLYDVGKAGINYLNDLARAASPVRVVHSVQFVLPPEEYTMPEEYDRTHERVVVQVCVDDIILVKVFMQGSGDPYTVCMLRR
jgi:hypothetical protein